MNGYVALCVVYSFALTMSNIMAGKFMALGSLNLPSAIVIFPIVYIASDLMTEIYGIRRSLFAIRLNTCIAALFALFSWILLKLPPAVFWQNQGTFVERIKKNKDLTSTMYCAANKKRWADVWSAHFFS